MPVENEILNISANWEETSFLSSFNILVGVLFCPTDLYEFREDVIFCISYLLVGLRKRSSDFYLLGNQKNNCVSN